MNTEELLETFKGMTLLELSKFVKDFEETFGVTAATPMTQMVLTELPAIEPVPVDEPEEWTVAITELGDKKIQVIKEVRAITKLGLAEAKAVVDNLPNSIVENVDKERALEVKAALEKTGATVTMVPSP